MDFYLITNICSLMTRSLLRMKIFLICICFKLCSLKKLINVKKDSLKEHCIFYFLYTIRYKNYIKNKGIFSLYTRQPLINSTPVAIDCKLSKRFCRSVKIKFIINIRLGKHLSMFMLICASNFCHVSA